MFQHPVAGYVEHLKNLLEAVVVPIRVGDALVAAGVAKIQDEVDLVVLFFGGGEAEDIATIGVIHGEHEVEVVEVVRFEQAGLLVCNVNAVLAGGDDGAMVGVFAGMPGRGACGIHLPVEALLLYFMLHNAFG